MRSSIGGVALLRFSALRRARLLRLLLASRTILAPRLGRRNGSCGDAEAWHDPALEHQPGEEE